VIRRSSILVTALLWSALAASADYPVHRHPRTTPVPPEGSYEIFPDQPRQIIKGLGFEIQSDSIASGNKGLPEEMSGVPHDLVPSERERFYNEMLHGFRYCRLAGGLFWRGLDADQKHFQGRWPGQIGELKEMIQQAGIEGVSFEYWSPAPYWKASHQLAGKVPGTQLRCFRADFANDPDYHGDVDRFLKDLADACRQDLQTLRDGGIPISMWGLQNEPPANTGYSSCYYTGPQYSRTFAAVAPEIRAFDPKISITADDWNLGYIRAAMANPQTAALVDAFVIHHVGSNSNVVKGPVGLPGFARPSYQNEYEYLDGSASPDRCLNTVQHIMNWFQLGKAPTWFWIHALKPVGNSEGSGYALGFWRPPNYSGPVKPEFANLEPGHWTWNRYNWYAVAGFLRHMPWDSQAVTVREENKDDDLRIFAFKRPDGKLVIVLSNRSGVPFKFNLKTGMVNSTFTGYRYTPEDAGQDFNGEVIGTSPGQSFSPQLADRTWEFWVQN
jgi:hypothetical protein